LRLERENRAKNIKERPPSLVGWFILGIAVLQRQRQEDFEFKASPGLNSKTLFKKKGKGRRKEGRKGGKE
jgi:hypothetical protein